MVSLTLSKKFSRKQKMKAINIIKKGAKENKNSSVIRKELELEGLSYRKQNSLDDIRKTKATIKAKTPEARERAEDWYNGVFEKFGKAKGITNRKKLEEMWYRAITQTAETVEEAELNAEFWDFYHEIFG